MPRRRFYGMGEVCMVGNIESDGEASGEEKVDQASNNNSGDLWHSACSFVHRLSLSGAQNRESISGSLVKQGPTEEAVEDLQSRLVNSERLLADRDETIDLLTSELAAMKALYKETILGMPTNGLSTMTSLPGCISISPATPSRPQLRSKSAKSLRPAYYDDGDDENNDDKPETHGALHAAVNPVESSTGANAATTTPQSVAAQAQGGRMGARLGKSYSWRTGHRRQCVSASQAPVEIPL
ncbi:hypothetical protein VOLCADRAFT_103144 [Volvox carteri f. nagariensis]|uniref:Uncharacterized protein n=1 Tax=Volvox carteri f. nagariensis TaxID=3068 RepID=D8TJU0_VOLCA|nr:uncharacterized protein VOLCADRAFT_103144 [Volvox carteri f. nagariensis]EFJ51948.1 hypothetical protein VOLCADRAFT_103144 [Volvox carteri f. nagariensis]|eukprot:XP_002946722.1 hypothetical protein VOLCADRAFT_103144 [Volvox carteri f. nagariensis]